MSNVYQTEDEAEEEDMEENSIEIIEPKIDTVDLTEDETDTKSEQVSVCIYEMNVDFG